MLDKTSEKILKFAISKYNGNMEDEIEILPAEAKLHYSELDAVCNNLYKNGYIQSFIYSGSQNRNVSFYLTHSGLHYFEMKKKNFFYICIKSVWIPIIVTLLTKALTALIKYLLPLILQWLTSAP